MNLNEIPLEKLVSELERRGLKRIQLSHLDALLDIGTVGESDTPTVITTPDKKISIVFHGQEDINLTIAYLDDESRIKNITWGNLYKHRNGV